jgi:hypothetical protein
VFKNNVMTFERLAELGNTNTIAVEKAAAGPEVIPDDLDDARFPNPTNAVTGGAIRGDMRASFGFGPNQ